MMLSRSIEFLYPRLRRDKHTSVMAFIDSDNPLAAEILQEAAEAFFAACKKMVDSLEALRAFDDATASSTQADEQDMRRSQLVDYAAERVLFVLIQREAMKL